MITVKVDHKLRIARGEIPTEIEGAIQEALSIPNLERQKAMEQNTYGWQSMPEKIYLWEIEGTDLVMPRGFTSALLSGLDDFDAPFRLEDHRTSQNGLSAPPPIELRPWQKPAVVAIKMFEQGIWKAPPASGKTVGVLEAIRRTKGRSIVIVNTKDILWQWQDRAKRFLGEDFEVGQIGDNKFDVSDFLTIATAQTLHSRFDKLERDGFFDLFSFVCLDECHHATADTYNRLLNRFSAKYRIGVSATPDKTGDFALATHVLGPIFHTTHRKDVTSLITPEVFKIPTNFSFKYKERQGSRPSNYPQLLDKLIHDEERNELIVKSILIQEGTHALVISKRLEHLDILKEMLEEFGYQEPVFTLIGNSPPEKRQAVVNIANARPCCVLSTLADEALDIPRLDSLFLVFPQRNPGLIEQQVGRICRTHPDKDRALVFDFADTKVGPLDRQWKERRTKVYMVHKYEVQVARAADIMAYEIGSDEDDAA